MSLEKVIELVRGSRAQQIHYIRVPEIEKSEDQWDNGIAYNAGVLVFCELRYNNHVHRFVVLRDSRIARDIRKLQSACLIRIEEREQCVGGGFPRMVRYASDNFDRAKL